MFNLLHKISEFKKSENKFYDRLKLVCFLFFVTCMGMELARITRDSYFLVDAGPRKIPYMYIFIAILMLVGSSIYGSVVGRMRRDKLLKVLLLIGIILGGVSFSILAFDLNIPYFSYILFCVVEAYITFVLLHFWNYMSNVFDNHEGKKSYPIIGGVGLLGTVAAGLLTKIITTHLGTDYLLLLWCMLSAIGTLVISKIFKLTQFMGHSGDTILDVEEENETGLGFTSVKELFKIPLIRTMIYISFPLWVIIYIIEFNFFNSMNRVYTNQDQLAGFLGLFSSVACFIGLALQFTFTPWLIKKVGVGATAMVYPFSLAIGSFSLMAFSLFPSASDATLLMPGIVLMVVFARFCDIAVYFSVYESTSQLIYYAISEKLRSKARAFISGIITPLCTATAGALLILFQFLNEPVFNVAFVGVSLAFGLLVFGLKLTPDYLKSMITAINPEDSKSRENIAKEIMKLQESDVRYVLIGSLTSENEEEASFAAIKLYHIKDEEMFYDIEEIVEQIKPKIKRTIFNLMSDKEKRNYPNLALALQA